MPIKRYRKRRYYKKKLSGTEKKQVKTIVKRTLNSNLEEKHISANSGIVGVSDTPTTYTTVLPIQGQLIDERIGNKIKLKSFLCKYTVYLQDPSNVVRVIIFQWKSNSFGVPTPPASQILQVTSPYPWLSQINQDTRQNVKILYDKTHTMQNGGPLQITRSVNLRKFAITNYECVSAALGSNNLQKGEIFLLLVSDSALAPNPTFVWRFMLKYTDA